MNRSRFELKEDDLVFDDERSEMEIEGDKSVDGWIAEWGQSQDKKDRQWCEI